MASKQTIFFYIALFCCATVSVSAEPAIAFGYNPLQICLENCVQCKKMLGSWFEGPLCAESCIQYRGKFIPDCEDFASIAPFLNKL